MFELQPSQFSIAEPLFRSSAYGALAYGTLEGGHPGRVFVDQVRSPELALVCTRVGYYFLVGHPTSLPELRDLFLKELAPVQKATIGDPQILLFYDTPAWKAPLFSLFADHQPISIRKKRMILPPAAFTKPCGWQDRVPQGMQVVPITPHLLQAHPDLAGEVSMFWGSFEGHQQKGMGYCMMDGDAIASVCQTVFVGCGEAEISIATKEAYRRRGLGFLTAWAFVDACQQRGLKPVWGCWPNNEPSVALAYRLGFVDDAEQEICFWEERSV